MGGCGKFALGQLPIGESATGGIGQGLKLRRTPSSSCAGVEARVAKCSFFSPQIFRLTSIVVVVDGRRGVGRSRLVRRSGRKRRYGFRKMTRVPQSIPGATQP